MIMSPNSTHDLPAPHTDGVHHRREAATRTKEMKPLLTREPLSYDREKKPAAQPKKRRKHVVPSTPALSFDPKRSHVPSGKQDPPVSPSIYSRPSTSESSTSSYDEQQATSYVDRGLQEPSYNGRDAQKRPRISSDCSSEHATSYYSGTPYTDTNSTGSVPLDFYDSPASYTSSSSPDPSDQSPCAADFAVQVVGYARPVPSMYPYGDQVYVQPAVVHQDSYGYTTGPYPDRHAQGDPTQHSDVVYGRPVPHGIPGYPENNGYPYPPRKY